MEDTWSQLIKKRKHEAQGYCQKEKAMQMSILPEGCSHLAKYLLEEYAFGGLSANQVQKLSMMAQFDGVKHPHINKLASLGTTGLHPGNMNRDLVRYTKKYMHPIENLDPDFCKIPLKILKGPKTGTHLIPHYYLAPHKLLSFMYDKFRPCFRQKILGNAGAMEEFWSGIADDDPRLIQLVKDHPDYKKKCVPIIIHGDGVPCTNNHSLDAISFESILAKRGMGNQCSTLDYIFFITGLFTQTMDSDNTNGLGLTKVAMWKLVVHSLKACYYGHWPQKDPDGKDFPGRSLNSKKIGDEIMGGYVLVPWILKGDMDFQINHFEFPGHWQSHHPCPCCPCNKVDDSQMAWNYFSPDAEWMTSGFETLEDFQAHCTMLGKPFHLIFEPLEGRGLGMHPRSLYMDSLHVVDLGVCMHVGGNVLHDLCYDGMLPNDAATNMANVWTEIAKLYEDQQTTSQFPWLGLTSFIADEKSPHADFPKLRGKGAQLRHLMPILAVIWKRHMRRDNSKDMHVERMLDHLVRFYKCLDHKNAMGVHPFHLPMSIALKMLNNVQNVLLHYSWLSEQSLSQVPARFKWNIVTKFHYFWHLAKQAQDINPRMAWCYANEDFVGKIAVIGMSCRHGQVAAWRSNSLMMKYIFGITLRMIHESS